MRVVEISSIFLPCLLAGNLLSVIDLVFIFLFAQGYSIAPASTSNPSCEDQSFQGSANLVTAAGQGHTWNRIDEVRLGHRMQLKREHRLIEWIEDAHE
jgi:hypothetical protein